MLVNLGGDRLIDVIACPREPFEEEAVEAQ